MRQPDAPPVAAAETSRTRPGAQASPPAPGTVPLAAVAEASCTCGELVQGYLDGEPFLVSCPIDRYSRVRVTLDTHSNGSAGFSKATRAATLTLSGLGRADRTFSLHVDCSLPQSRGFGTSTADVAAAIVAAAEAAGGHVDPLEVAGIAVSVEPSDSTMLPGLAVFNHRTAKGALLLGAAPPLDLVILDFGGTVDTLEYNAALNLDYLQANEPGYAEALGLLQRGLDERRWDLVGRAATMSARLNQFLLPKPGLEGAIRLAEEHGGLGVCAAHSGTILGILLPPGSERQATALAGLARERLPGLERSWVTTMVDGGARVAEASLHRI